MARSSTRFPERKSTPEAILAALQAKRSEDSDWKNGRVWALSYWLDAETYQLAQDAYCMYFSENGLNPAVYPSLRQMEQEVVSMSADLLNGDDEVCGNMTSGGTESILMAVFTAKQAFLAKNPDFQGQPEVVVPITAHPAFDKAFHYFDLKPIHIAQDENFRVLVDQAAAAITERTCLIIGSAPSYPMGTIDDIPALGQLALQHEIPLHVDACIGGFILPFLERNGAELPYWDFRVPGVMSISADMHKYGYTAKGASVLLHRSREYRKNMFFVYTEWPGGIYASPGVSGTRPGGAIAAAWAVMNYQGLEGYTEKARELMSANQRLIEGINNTPGLYVMGDPDATFFAVGAEDDGPDIYTVADELSVKGWHMDRQQYPESFHLTVNQVHVAHIDAFLSDLQEAVALAKKRSLRSVGQKAAQTVLRGAVKVLPEKTMSRLLKASSRLTGSSDKPVGKRTAAMYGMMAELPNRGDVHGMILDLLDKLGTEPAQAKAEEQAEEGATVGKAP